MHQLPGLLVGIQLAQLHMVQIMYSFFFYFSVNFPLFFYTVVLFAAPLRWGPKNQFQVTTPHAVSRPDGLLYPESAPMRD